MQLAVKVMDFSILCGHRGKDEQAKSVLAGYSKTNFPNSKHNKYPSHAIDIAPYPYNAAPTIKNLARFYYLAGIVQAIAQELEIEIKWGGDWLRTATIGHCRPDFTKNNFDDLFHFELINVADIELTKL
jgi:peptidoglycan L-alanyl-D-glutamate endopeptidase CwlK